MEEAHRAIDIWWVNDHKMENYRSRQTWISAKILEKKIYSLIIVDIIDTYSKCWKQTGRLTQQMAKLQLTSNNSQKSNFLQ